MKAIFRRELGAYFTSPIGYIYIALFCIFAGLYFFGTTLVRNTTDLRGVFASVFVFAIFLIPLLTMRLISEDFRLRTDQLLLTVPIKLSAIVWGKFFAVVVVFALGNAITLVYALVLSFFAPVDWMLVICHYLGLLLAGAAFISIGLFVSSLTENQIIAAIGGFSAAAFLMLLDVFAGVVPIPLVRNLLISLSFSVNYADFTLGIINPASVVYFLSVCTAFLFFAQQTFERKRWKK